MTTEGPALVKSEGERETPTVGLELSLNKSCAELVRQLKVLVKVRCEHAAAILAHPNPCAEDILPVNTTVFQVQEPQDLFQVGVDITDRWL
jgi:hypothetical protein